MLTFLLLTEMDPSGIDTFLFLARASGIHLDPVRTEKCSSALWTMDLFRLVNPGENMAHVFRLLVVEYRVVHLAVHLLILFFLAASDESSQEKGPAIFLYNCVRCLIN